VRNFVEQKLRVGGVDFVVKGIPIWMRDFTEIHVDLRVAQRVDILVALELIRHGMSGCEALRFMRKAAQCSGVSLAVRLDRGVETVMEWERGSAPIPPSAWVDLANIVLNEAVSEGRIAVTWDTRPDTLQYLATNPIVPSQPIVVEWPPITEPEVK
jgi:DNA-binding transcriptional regulator YiaG